MGWGGLWALWGWRAGSASTAVRSGGALRALLSQLLWHGAGGVPVGGHRELPPAVFLEGSEKEPRAIIHHRSPPWGPEVRGHWDGRCASVGVRARRGRVPRSSSSLKQAETSLLSSQTAGTALRALPRASPTPHLLSARPAHALLLLCPSAASCVLCSPRTPPPAPTQHSPCPSCLLAAPAALRLALLRSVVS